MTLQEAKKILGIGPDDSVYKEGVILVLEHSNDSVEEEAARTLLPVAIPLPTPRPSRVTDADGNPIDAARAAGFYNSGLPSFAKI